MARGSYLGGSTVIHAGSDWFSKPSEEMTSAERFEKLQEKREGQRQEMIARLRAREKAERKKAAEKEERARKAKKARKLQEDSKKRRNDPEYLALVAEVRRKQEEKVKNVVVEVRRSKRLRQPRSADDH